MARVRRNATLDSRDARRELKVRAEPYWHRLHKGLFLGYRKLSSGGAWIARRYDSEAVRYAEERLGAADDYLDADGAKVLSFAQASRRTQAEATEANRRASGQLYTVADAVSDYVEYLRTHRKSAADAELKLKAYALPKLGDRRVADLRTADFDDWLKWAMRRQQRRKPRRSPARQAAETATHDAGADEAPKGAVDTEDKRRRRKSTLNRVIATLKACLNHAHASGKVASRDPWSRLKKFRAVDSARVRWLTVAEAKRLMNACAPSFRPLVEAGLVTGCRPGELLAARARDFDPQSKTFLIPDSKSGKPRRVPLTDEGVALFESLTAGKPEDAGLFARQDGSPWHRVAIIRAMADACDAGKITPPATFYTLRHTFASLLVQRGTPLLFVAAALGHRDERMVSRHYGHLAPSHIAAMIREKLPSFGIRIDRKVRRLRP